MGWAPIAVPGLPSIVLWGDATNAQRVVRQQRQRMLVVGVDQNDGIALGVLDACGQCRFLAEVTRQTEITHATFGRYRGDCFIGFIAAAIVDDDDFVVWRELFQRFLQVAQEVSDVG